MFGPVQTKLNNIITNRFISCLIGSGKTTQMLMVINSILEKGENCLLVTPSTYLIKEQFPDKILPKGLTVIHIDTLLKYLKRYAADNNEYTNKNPDQIPFKFIELFNSKRVVIDPECYIKIIQQYQERFNILKMKLAELQKL